VLRELLVLIFIAGLADRVLVEVRLVARLAGVWNSVRLTPLIAGWGVLDRALFLLELVGCVARSARCVARCFLV